MHTVKEAKIEAKIKEDITMRRLGKPIDVSEYGKHGGLKSLNEFATAIGEVVDIGELLQVMAEVLAKFTYTKGCVIRLKENDSLHIRGAYGLDSGILSVLNHKIGEEIPRKVMEINRSILVTDTSELQKELKILQTMVRSMACVPIKKGGKPIGTIELYDKEKPEFQEFPESTEFQEAGGPLLFTAGDVQTLENYAILASMSIDRAYVCKNANQLQEIVEANKRRIEIITSDARRAIITVDRGMAIKSANQMVENWTRHSLPDVIGKRCEEVFDDLNGILPHLLAERAFTTGKSYTETYSNGAKYAEISVYPLDDTALPESSVSTPDSQVTDSSRRPYSQRPSAIAPFAIEQSSKGQFAKGPFECIVIIKDLSDKIDNQNKIAELHDNVAQTREHLQSLIDNSADAIVTTDLEGIITSWNRSAERIFGYAAEEIVGEFIPFLPNFTFVRGKEFLDIISSNEVLKDIEITGKRKNLSPIDISITISPIKDAHGKVTGISIITRDISRRKMVENELIKSSRKLSHLFFINSAMRSTLELDKLLRMILTVVTVSDGLSFNRAVLFLYDENRKALRGTMAVGPSSSDESWQLWQEFSSEKRSLHEILDDIDKGPLKRDTFLNRLSIGLDIFIEDNRNSYLSLAVTDKMAINVQHATKDPKADPLLIQLLATEAYAIVPLISRDKVIGVIWVDNLYNRQPITDDDMEFLSTFADQAATAIESARLFEKVKFAENELENIFESISDGVYTTDHNMNVIKANKAVCDQLGIKEADIIGKKCHEVFHNHEYPWPACPHAGALDKQKAFIAEVENFYYNTNDTFSVSISPIYDPYGQYKGTVHIVSNVTEFKKLREQLTRIEKVAALGEMAARVAHEIRNPLSTIGGFARRLEKKLDGPLKEYATIIVEEVGRLENLLRQIIGFVRETKISSDIVDINALLRSITKMMQQNFGSRVLIEEHYTNETLEIIGNPTRLQDVFVHLLNNAGQSIEDTGRIIVRTTRDYQNAIVEIEDTGSGISEEDLKLIFNPFYTTKTTGAGLGLTIASRVIEEHKGSINVMSKVEVGTIFKIKLLLKEAHNESIDS